MSGDFISYNPPLGFVRWIEHMLNEHSIRRQLYGVWLANKVQDYKVMWDNQADSLVAYTDDSTKLELACAKNDFREVYNGRFMLCRDGTCEVKAYVHRRGQGAYQEVLSPDEWPSGDDEVLHVFIYIKPPASWSDYFNPPDDDFAV